MPQTCPAVSPSSFRPCFILPEPEPFIPFAPTEHRIPFSRVPRTLLNAPGITLRDIKVYAAILSFPANDRHERWPGREKIGEITGLPPKVVSRTTTHLQKLGWLAKQGDGGRSRTTRYVIFDRAQPPEVIAAWEFPPLPKRKRKPSPKRPSKPRTNSAQTGPVSTPQTGPQTGPVSTPESDVNSAQTAPVSAPFQPPLDVETLPVSTPKQPLNRPQIEEGQAVENSDSADKREQRPAPASPEPAASKPDRSMPLSKGGRKESTLAPATIPDGWIETAREMRPDLAADQIDRSAGRFLDYHRAKGNEFKDWLPIWKIWISKERPDSPRTAAQPPQATRPVSRYAHLDKPKEPPTEAELRQFIVDPEKWTRGLDRMPRNERGDRRGKKAV